METTGESREISVILREKIKPELNKLYTERPDAGDERGQGDFGWFCREHALHCYFLFLMLGQPVTIRRGGITAWRSDGSKKYVSTVGSDSDHVWCEVAGIMPIDLSVNFEYYCGSFPWVDIVFGSGRFREFDVSYGTDRTAHEAALATPPERPLIDYCEHSAVTSSPDRLLQDPYSFLCRPPDGGLVAHFGDDIFAAISLHLFLLATGEAHRFTRDCRGRPGFELVAKAYPGARERVAALVKEQSFAKGQASIY